MTDISIWSLDSEAHGSLKLHFNERLNDKIYSTFKELFDHVKIDSIKEVLPIIDMYNSAIWWYTEDINLKYGVALSCTHLKVSEIGHWAKTSQVATVVTIQTTYPKPTTTTTSSPGFYSGTPGTGRVT